MHQTQAGHAPVPTFFLYGEPRRRVSPRFLHLETLEERSRASDGHIRPHAHADLHHVFLLSAGGGTMQADGVATGFAAPCLLLVPARIVHGFAFTPDASGQVLTVADAYLRKLLAREAALAGLFARAGCVPAADVAGLSGRMATLARELAWSAPGHTAAVDATLLLILVEALRLRHRDDDAARPPPGRAALLVARFRELVEASYRSGRSLERMAAALGVAPAVLRRACAQEAGCTPVAIVQERVFLEAQRLLLYTHMGVAEAAAYLGFEDSAYFSRFFTRHAGCSPRRFRDARQESAFSGAGVSK
jgi:AraC family transcriptional activator of pobA